MAVYIIVEGPDGAGKTTLINKLLKVHSSTEYIHFGVPEDYTLQFDMYRLAIAKNYSKDIVIFDRSWYSDQVYAPIMRQREEMTAAQVLILERTIEAYGGGMVLYLTADPDVLWERCTAEGESYIPNKETLAMIAHKYEAVMAAATLPVVKSYTDR